MDDNRRGRALAGALVIFAGVGVFTAPITFLVPPSYQANIGALFVGCIGCMGLGAALGYRGWVDTAGAGTGIAVSVVIAWCTVTMGLVTEAIWFLALGLLVASFAASPRVVALVYVVDLVLLGIVQGRVPVLIHAGDKVPLLPSVLSMLTSVAVSAALNAELANRALRRMREAQRAAEVARASAEEASRAKSLFLANMSHELRTPLNAILGYSDLLLEELGDEVPDTSRADLSRIQASGRHLLSLISDVLDLARIETGKLEVDPERVEVMPFVRELAEGVRPQVEARGNVFRYTVDERVEAVVTDRTRLAQILSNLLTNGAKFTQDGEIVLTVSATADGVVWAVSDTGIGMDAETLGRVFEPFVQGDGSSTKVHAGAGIGLALCRQLAVLLGGDLAVTSEVGVGSTFRLTIPA